MEVEKKDWLWFAAGFTMIMAIGGALFLVFGKKKDDPNDKSSSSANPGKNNKGKAGSGEAGLKVEGTTDPWDINYWQDMSRQIGGKVKILTADSSRKLAQQIYSAEGALNDDEDSVYRAIGALKSKVQLSYLADVFKKIYKMDMLDYLKGFLSEDDELPKVNSIVSALPAYTV